MYGSCIEHLPSLSLLRALSTSDKGSHKHTFVQWHTALGYNSPMHLLLVARPGATAPVQRCICPALHKQLDASCCAGTPA